MRRLSTFTISFVAALGTLLLALWCSSGTMGGYAASHHTPHVLEPCRYLHNLDYSHFVATFLFLDGADPSTWSFSFYLRRILYPLAAYPLMKLLGYEWGGFITNLFIHAASFSIFVFFLRRRYGERAALTGMWLTSTYPGIAYWGGLPYAHSTIVPCSLVLFVLLWKLDEAVGQLRSGLYALSMGLLFLAYDLMPFFGAAACLLLLWRRAWIRLLVSLCLLPLPSIAVNLILQHVYGVNPSNPNSNSYSIVINSYLTGLQWDSWLPILRDVPRLFAVIYLDSNFLFLPLLFIALLLLNLIAPRLWLNRVESTLLLAVLAVFLINNLAPPYSGWQMRGDWIARIYQPVVVVFLSFASRLSAAPDLNRHMRVWIGLFVALTVLGNAAITFGSILGLGIADYTYYRFYRHSTPTALSENMQKFGRRPLGFCVKKVKIRGKRAKHRVPAPPSGS